jgi:hypothetical protein
MERDVIPPFKRRPTVYWLLSKVFQVLVSSALFTTTADDNLHMLILNTTFELSDVCFEGFFGLFGTMS